MSKPTLLADLAVRLAQSPEDIATEALTLILGRSPAARQALNSLVGHWSGADYAIVRWKAQVVGADDSRTDMEGEDGTGLVHAILENKFWAGLTDNQPATYLGRLPPDGGILVFVVPCARLSAIQLELAERVAVAGRGRCEFGGTGASRITRLSETQTLVVTTWEALLGAIASALEAADDHPALADLRQLQGLAEKMDTEGFVPFKASDITGPSARLLLQCYSVVDEAWSLVARNPCVEYSGRAKAVGAGWWGQYFKLHGVPCTLMVSVQRWAKFGISPVWFCVNGSNRQLLDTLYAPLAAALPDPAWLQHERDGYFVGLWLPIRLLEGRERGVVAADVASQVEKLGSVMAACLPA